jgi:maltoporin
MAAIIATASTAGAQGAAVGNPEPEKVAQATPPTDPTTEPPPSPMTGDSPTAPGVREPAPASSSDEAMRKIAAEEAAKVKPHGPSLEFAGYARAGVGLNVKGGKQVCFGLAGADAKWRLGNECDYVIEPQFTGRLVSLPDKSSWGVVVMPGLYRTYEDPNGADRTFYTNIPAEFRQIYFFGENIPQLANGRVWGGRRYYDRLHIDPNDQFLEIHDSDGAGLEDMQLGPGKASIAFLMNPNSEASRVGTPPVSTANLAPYTISARYTGIPTMPEGELQIWAGFDGSSTSTDKKDAGVVIAKPDSTVRIAAYHTIGKILGGSNLIGAKMEYGDNHLLLRGTVQEGMLFNNGHTGVDAIVEFRYAKDKMGGNDVTNNWFSIGARFDTQISGPFRFLFEPGFDRVFADSTAFPQGDPQLIKATVALAANAGDGPGARPTVRVFYTHGFWNDAAKTSPLGVFAHGQSGNRLEQVYGANADNGGSFGIQAEAWW